MRHFVGFTLLLTVLAGSGRGQDIVSGPARDAKVPALKVYDATGEHKDKEVDYAAQRKDKPTVYLFIDAEKFDRPMNRFMKTLDGAVKKDFGDAYLVAVWLTADADKTKALLPRVQESVRYEATALTLFADKAGPKDWNVNADAHLTVIVANKGVVRATFGYRSVNETDVPAVKEKLAEATRKK
jgi:hypothetical protein